MTPTPTGGPAFPLLFSPSRFSESGDFIRAEWQDGMTLRDYFAAAADVGEILDLIPYETAEELAGKSPSGSYFEAPGKAVEMLTWRIRLAATVHFMFADAMLRARSAEGGGG